MTEDEEMKKKKWIYHKIGLDRKETNSILDKIICKKFDNSYRGRNIAFHNIKL